MIFQPRPGASREQTGPDRTRPPGSAPSGCGRARRAGVARAALLVGAAFVGLSLFLRGAPSNVRSAEVAPEPDSPQLFRQVASALENHYLDPARIRPRELTERAFAALENAVDEVYVDYSEETKPYAAVHLESKVQVFNLDSVSALDSAVRLLENVFVFVRNNYRGEQELNEMRYAAANGFLSGLDPHTMVFSPKAFQEFSVTIKGEIYGIGMLVGSRDGKLTVIEVLKDTPAARAGFRKGDLIVKIGDESTINMTVPEAVDKIRGPLKSWVTLAVRRQKPEGDAFETLEIPVQRDLVTIKSVESKLLPPEEGVPGAIGYAKVVNFDQNTTDGLRENLRRLVEKNGGRPLAGLILDLRGNSGGLLTQAVQMSDLFLKSGTIVIQAMRATRGQQFYVQEAEDGGDEPDCPIVVLANAASASGAEIVTGALQKNRRAVVLGTRTFGKGSVQQLHRLSSGAQLKITVSEYLLPGKISIQENGVVPDVLANPVVVKEGSFDLFPDEPSMTERVYSQHIVSKFAKKEVSTFRLDYYDEVPEEDYYSDRFLSGELEPEKDRLVRMALRLLGIALSGDETGKGRPSSERPAEFFSLLEGQAEKVLQYKAELFDEIVKKLAEVGIDWTSGEPAPAAIDPKDLELRLSSEFTTKPSKDKDDPVPLRFVVVTARLKNTGGRTLFRMKGLSRSEYRPYRDREFLFGRIEPGEEVERRVKIQLPYLPQSRSDLLTVDVSASSGSSDPEAKDDALISASIAIEQSAAGKPAFSYSAELFEGTSPADLKPVRSLEPDRRAVLKVKLRNVGTASVFKGVAVLRNETGRQIFLHEPGRIAFPEAPVSRTASIGFTPDAPPEGMKPGDVAEFEFSFEVRRGDPVDFYKFEFGAIDSYSNAGISHEILIPPREKEDARPFPNGVDFVPPRIAAWAEVPASGGGAAERVLVTKSGSVVLRAEVRGGDRVGFKAWIFQSLSGDQEFPDKIFFADSRGEPVLEISQNVKLAAGSNSFTVVARDRNGIENRETVFVRRE